MSTSMSRNIRRWVFWGTLAGVLGTWVAISLSEGYNSQRVAFEASSGPETSRAIGWPRLIEYRLKTLYTDDPNGPMRESIHVFHGASYDEWTDEQLSTSAPEPRQCWVALDNQLYDASNGCEGSFRAQRTILDSGASPNPYLAPVDATPLAKTPSDQLTDEEIQLARRLRISTHDLHASMVRVAQPCYEVGFLNCSEYDSRARERILRVVVHVPSRLTILDQDLFDGNVIHDFVVQDIQRGRPYGPPSRAKEAQQNRDR